MQVKEADLINDNNSNNNAEGVVEKKVNGIKGNFTNSSSKPDIKKPGEQYIVSPERASSGYLQYFWRV